MRRRGDGDLAGAPPRQRPCVALTGGASEARGAPVGSANASGGGNPGLNPRLTTNDALTYLRDVKNMFINQREVYETFLEIMKEFKAQTIDTYGVIQRVKQLFKGNKNLIIGFNTFLPKGFEIRMEDLLREEAQEQQMAAGKQPVEFDQAINYVNKIKDRFRTDESVYKNFLEILNQYRKAQRGIKEVYDQVAYLFRDHDDLLEEFTYFLPDSQAPHRAAMERQRLAAAQREHETSSRRQRLRADAVQPYDFQRDCAAMFEKIRRRVANSTWNDFLKVLMMYVDNVINEVELQELVSCVIGTASNDLVGMFEDFMRRAPTLEFGEDVIDAITKAVTNKTSSHYAAKDKYLRLPISEVIDPARCEKLNVSYIQVPADYPKLNFSARKKLPMELQQLPLNNNWVSVTQGSEDYSFRSMRRNQYEEALFRIEDDRYDLELLIERNNSVLRKIDSLLAKVAAVNDEMMTVRFEETSFSTIQKRHIYTVYGSADQAETMFNALLSNPQEALPVVRERLVAKGGEWAKVLSEMEVYWQRQFNQNYTRSLDHRSFYFKVVDKKLLGQRYIIQEIKEAAEATQQHPEAALSVHTSAPADIKLRPHLLLDMPDMDVHGDVWALIQIGFVGSESMTQVEQFWRQIVLPFFGISDLDSITPEFGPPSPAAEAERSGPADTPVETPAPSQDASGAVAGGAEQSGVSSRENNAAPSTGVSSEGAEEAATALVAASEATPLSSAQEAGDSPPAAPASRTDPSASGSAEGGDAGQNGAVQMEVDNVDAMRGGSGEAQESDDAEMATEASAPSHGAASIHDAAPADEEMVAEDDEEEEEAERGDEEEDIGADPEASEASKLEESDVDDVEESGGISDAKRDDKADAADDEEDEEEEPATHGLMSSPSKLPIDFNRPTKVGQDGSPLEPCPVRSQAPADMRKLKMPGQPEVKEVQELYCNEAMYGFWRLYHYCYERLQVARNCILEKHGKSSRTAMQGNSEVEKSSAGDATASQQGSGETGQPQVSPPGQGGNGSVDSEEIRAMRKKFFQLLYSHIVHKTDVTVFEDTCRSMLGANSFVLFTIQKLVLKLARHLASVIADDSSVKLINLHHYEKRRRQPVHWSVRFANAAQTHSEDHAIRIASREDGSMAVTWVEFDRMDPCPWPCDPDARNFLDAYMKISEKDVAAHQKQRNSPTLFLKRTLHSSLRNSDKTKRMEHLGKFYIRNGLESKLKQDDGSNQKDLPPSSRKSASNRRFSYKFNFVLDTEDAMMCCKKRQKTADAAKVRADERQKHLSMFRRRVLDKPLGPQMPGGAQPARRVQ